MAITNISHLGHAFQSSTSKWSRAEDEANYALSDSQFEDYAFHTWDEPHAWWIVDLHRPYPIRSVKVFLRKGYEKRNHDIKFSISPDLLSWHELGKGVIASTDLVIKNFDDQLARFIRIEIANTYLHLRKVEIYGDPDPLYFRGCLMHNDPGVASCVRDAIKNQSYERKEIDLALSNLDKGDNVLELGASLGAVSTCVLKERKISRYVAVEANPDLIPLIKENHSLNNVSCEVINAAAGLADGQRDFYFHPISWSSSLIPFDNPVKVEKVPVINFNKLLNQTKSNFIICDIEGGEYDIFNDEAVLDSVNKILIELHPLPNKSCGDLFDYFIGKGFVTANGRPREDRSSVLFFSRPG